MGKLFPNPPPPATPVVSPLTQAPRDAVVFVSSDTERVLQAAEALGMRTARHVGMAVHMGMRASWARRQGAAGVKVEDAYNTNDVARLMLDWFILSRAKEAFTFDVSSLLVSARQVHDAYLPD